MEPPTVKTKDRERRTGRLVARPYRAPAATPSIEERGANTLTLARAHEPDKHRCNISAKVGNATKIGDTRARAHEDLQTTPTPGT
jgi:hypothetical protein